MMLKLKLQYFGHLMQRVDSLEKALMTSLAPHERLPEILVVPREKTPTGAAARDGDLSLPLGLALGSPIFPLGLRP